MKVREGYGISNCFIAMVNKVVTATNFSFGYCFTKVAMEVPMVDVDAAAYASNVESSNFEVGETLFYTRDGWSGLVKAKALCIDEDGVLRIAVRTSVEKEIHTTKEFLSSPNNPGIGWIPSSIPEFRSTANQYLI